MANISQKLSTIRLVLQVEMEETERQELMEIMEVAFLLLLRKLRIKMENQYYM